jgi:hypothetical protein
VRERTCLDCEIAGPLSWRIEGDGDGVRVTNAFGYVTGTPAFRCTSSSRKAKSEGVEENDSGNTRPRSTWARPCKRSTRGPVFDSSRVLGALSSFITLVGEAQVPVVLPWSIRREFADASETITSDARSLFA